MIARPVQSVAVLLTEAEHLVTEAGEGKSANTLAELAGRLRCGRLQVAVLGQFKRGKSTVLNALLGEPFLPASVIPLTAVPTLVSDGPERRLQIVFRDGRPTGVWRHGGHHPADPFFRGRGGKPEEHARHKPHRSIPSRPRAAGHAADRHARHWLHACPQYRDHAVAYGAKCSDSSSSSTRSTCWRRMMWLASRPFSTESCGNALAWVGDLAKYKCGSAPLRLRFGATALGDGHRNPRGYQCDPLHAAERGLGRNG